MEWFKADFNDDYLDFFGIMDSDEKNSNDEEYSSDDEDVVPLEMYPEAKLVSFELKGSSAAADQEVRELKAMKLQDNTFKRKLRTDDNLWCAFGSVFTCQVGPRNFTSDASKKRLKEIEDALVHRLLFAVRQRRLVTKLENKELLANSALAWKDATSELNEASKIVFIWTTERLKPLSTALMRELNSVMTDEDFDDGLRGVLTQELNRERELFWAELSKKNVVSHHSAIVKAFAERASGSDDEEKEEEV
jgi:hypothetical protein